MIVFVQLHKQVSTWRDRWPAAELTRRGLPAICYAAGGQAAGPIDARDTVIWHISPETPNPEGYARLLRPACRHLVVQLDDNWTAIDAIQTRTAAAMEWVASLLGAVKLADQVIVATPPLVDAYAPYAVDTPVVIRNYPPAELRAMPRPRSLGCAGWMGRLGVHTADIAPLAKLWPADRMLAFIGSGPAAQQLHPWAVWTMPTDDEAALYSAMATIKVAMVPLTDHQFNRGKSWNKALEFLTLGVPVVAAAMPAYLELAGHVDTGLALTRSHQAMVDVALDWLAHPPPVSLDPALVMEAAGGNAWQTFVERLDR